MLVSVFVDFNTNSLSNIISKQRRTMKEIKKYWFVLLTIAILIFGFFLGQDFKKKIKSKGRFTIGRITKYHGGRPPYLIFEYTVDGVLYYSDTTPGDKTLIGKRFYVTFLEEDKKDGVILLFYPVPDNIKEAPREGWSRMPNVDWRMRDSLKLFRFDVRSHEYLSRENWR